ncbi:MAG: glycosyltransferase, partial [Bryobacteraceae bacterium]
MTTLHIDLGRQWRGGQNQALLLVQGLRARGHAAELVALRGSPLAERAQAAGVRVHQVGGRAARLQAALLLRKLLDQTRYDLVHCHDAHGLTAAWLAGVHKHAPVVASRRVAYPASRKPFALARYRSAQRIIAVSRFVREGVLASGLPGEWVEVVYDGVEVPRLPEPEERLAARRRWVVPDASDRALLGCVGYLLPEKAQDLLIRALPLVRERYPGCRLVLAGDGPCRRRLERLALQLGVGEVVEFAGKEGVVVLPGALTPTEVITAWKASADFVKVFPCAEMGGEVYIRALKAALSQVPMVAAGGVTLST